MRTLPGVQGAQEGVVCPFPADQITHVGVTRLETTMNCDFICAQSPSSSKAFLLYEAVVFYGRSGCECVCIRSLFSWNFMMIDRQNTMNLKKCCLIVRQIGTEPS